ncbi:hypothetical protein HC891_27315, partial [Candidatus Gracilibacteria bacterium]|nr:hypothetical protein [Candidatus Gracilibacteria bacterium]
MTIHNPSSGNLLQHTLAFGFLLREMGIAVSPGQMLDFVGALDERVLLRREDFRAAARCTLIVRHEDLPLFDAAFEFYWRAQAKAIWRTRGGGACCHRSMCHA